MTTRRMNFLAALMVVAGLTMAGVEAQQPPSGGGRGAGTAAQAQPKGTLKPVAADSRGWGWQVRSLTDSANLPLYNRAKQKLFDGKQVTSYTISRFDSELYCQVAPHYDFIWFEMQHSTMTYDEVARMIAACPKAGAAPMLRVPDAQEANMQKAGDIGVLGMIVPTVDDALESRDAGRFSRYPPMGRRSSGAGQAATIWSAPINYRQSINDNMLVVAMIETMEGVTNATEIAAQIGVDVIIPGNGDLQQFSGWTTADDRYQDLLIKIHDAAWKYGKYFGTASSNYLTGNILSPDVRLVQNGPAFDGFTPPARGRGAAAAPAAPPARGAGRGQ